ncbi:DUF551 domain-containing protein [Acinetobacter baumannii]|uniref:DUF551 domain-containing protein n=1 Tax=Acinetobacter baumannii TaxID=470 RepID=UPI002446D7F1|nr:DUF551 domain-containing protein [Acinetobacter baumannii]MDH2644720.1 DUF551 domain-containing protein [Acinetobacter baumannii]
MTDLNKLRSEFESNEYIKSIIQNFEWSEEFNNYQIKDCVINGNIFDLLEAKNDEQLLNGAWFGWQEKAKAQAVPEWISVDVKLPEIADASVLAHFQNGSIETVHIEDWFKDTTSGFDEAGNQTFTKWYLKASNTITHWMPLPEAPIETGA